MYEYDEECLQTFILNQGQLFDEPVAETLEEAEAFLEDCMASIVDNIGEVREFLDQEGMDVSGMSDEEIEDASEVFALSDGRYLIVQGMLSIAFDGAIVLGIAKKNPSRMVGNIKSKKTKVPAGWHRTGHCQM